MKKKRTSIKKLITARELSKMSGLEFNTINRYVRKRVLPYEKQDEVLTRYYDRKKALKRVGEIKELKEKGLTLFEMRRYFRKQDRVKLTKLFEGIRKGKKPSLKDELGEELKKK